MRILHIETGKHLYGGALQVLYLLKGLNAKGVQNTLVCSEGSAIAEAAATVANIAMLPMAGELDAMFPIRLRRILKTLRPDMVHVHSRRGADLWTPAAAAGLDIPLVVTRRVDNPEPRLLATLKYRRYRRIIAISMGIQNVLLSKGIAPHKIDCILSAVETAAYQRACDRSWFLNAFQLGNNVRAVAVIAQLIPRKGHRFLLEIAPELFRRFPEVRLLFFGKGKHGEVLRRQCEQEGLSGRVQFAGFREDLPRILPCLDLVVHPATMEGLGVSLLQASAAGVPIVASRTGGIPEIVEDNENGILVSPGDSNGLLEAISSVLGNTEAAGEMGLCGKKRVRKYFSVDRMVAGNLAVYRELLASENSRQSR